MDYTSKISLLCPTCKVSSFKEVGNTYVCSKCSREFTYKQLEKVNEGRINKEITSVYEKQILPDITKKLNENLKKAFKGNSFIKVK